MSLFVSGTKIVYIFAASFCTNSSCFQGNLMYKDGVPVLVAVSVQRWCSYYVAALRYKDGVHVSQAFSGTKMVFMFLWLFQVQRWC